MPKKAAVAENHVYKLIDLVGTSDKSLEHAIDTALGRAAKTVKNLRWFEVKHIRGLIEDGKAAYYQVSLQVGFTLDDPKGADS
jgi:flavin-binding protein dodecin